MTNFSFSLDHGMMIREDVGSTRTSSVPEPRSRPEVSVLSTRDEERWCSRRKARRLPAANERTERPREPSRRWLDRKREGEPAPCVTMISKGHIYSEIERLSLTIALLFLLGRPASESQCQAKKPALSTPSCLNQVAPIQQAPASHIHLLWRRRDPDKESNAKKDSVYGMTRVEGAGEREWRKKVRRAKRRFPVI